MQVPRRVDRALDAGLSAIREQFGVPSGFPPDVALAAIMAARRVPGAEHVDRTDRAFVTLDPARSTDLDQAFAMERAGADIVLHYAIADVGFFVSPGDPLDEEAWKRGVTVYMPDERARLYPAALSEGAASLLPDGPRPAVVFTARVDPDGEVALDGAERSLVHSRAKLAYDTVTPEQLPPDFPELARRIALAEQRRGAPRVEFPEQELAHEDGHWTLRFDPRLRSEDDNAGMSLATNLAVAGTLHAAGTGLFRVMRSPDEAAVGRLRHSARAFGLDWPAAQSLADFQRSLSTTDPRAAAFLIAVRRAGGGASYQPYVPGGTPWHSAMAATYSHATAPLRRLADRYVVEATLAVANGRPVPDDVQAAFAELPKAMAAGEALANRVDNAVIELAEAVLLTGREGEVFDAVVVDEDRRGTVVQLVDPAVMVRVSARNVDPGDEIRVRLTAVDTTARTTAFTRVG
ncbi:MAG: RNB domain-containing ribonuclease [Ilumatobacteraceae bacterium]